MTGPSHAFAAAGAAQQLERAYSHKEGHTGMSTSGQHAAQCSVQLVCLKAIGRIPQDSITQGIRITPIRTYTQKNHTHQHLKRATTARLTGTLESACQEADLCTQQLT